MQLDVRVPSGGARSAHARLEHGDLPVAIHSGRKFPHPDEALDDPRASRPKLFQPSRLFTVLHGHRGRQRPEDGANPTWYVRSKPSASKRNTDPSFSKRYVSSFSYCAIVVTSRLQCQLDSKA